VSGLFIRRAAKIRGPSADICKNQSNKLIVIRMGVVLFSNDPVWFPKEKKKETKNIIDSKSQTPIISPLVSFSRSFFRMKHTNEETNDDIFKTKQKIAGCVGEKMKFSLTPFAVFFLITAGWTVQEELEAPQAKS
jgi:hypothetical protein